MFKNIKSYNGSKTILMSTIICIIFYYFLSRYYLAQNNIMKSEQSNANLNWYSRRLMHKIILYAISVVACYIIYLFFFKLK